MVEIFFGIITLQAMAICRGTSRSVHELTAAIRRYIDACNQRAQPFTWTKTPTRSSPTPGLAVRSLRPRLDLGNRLLRMATLRL